MFSNQNIKVVTEDPQKYSLGYEFKFHSKMDFDKTEVLINNVINCGINVLEDINQSEEFKRGLLILIKGSGNSIEDTILEVLKLQKGMHAILKDAVVFCEDDGASLLLYNSALTIEFLQSLERTIKRK